MLAWLAKAAVPVTAAMASGRIFCAGVDSAGRKKVFSLGPDGGKPRLLVSSATYCAWQPLIK